MAIYLNRCLALWAVGLLLLGLGWSAAAYNGAAANAVHVERKVILSADSLRNKGTINLSRNWKYHSGDNAAWANLEFDDSTWETEDLPKAGWKGIGWFRLHIVVEPTLWSTPLGLYII